MLIFSFPGDSTKTCFAVPKVCDIYDGGFTFDGAPATKCILTDGEEASKFGVPAAGQGALLKSEGGVPQYVCKVRVGVGSGDLTWWSPCDLDSCTKNYNFAITCPAGGVDSDKGGLYF